MRPFITVACTLVMGVSRADASPTARLIYSRAVGAESCPDEDSLRRAVASRVGYDPFFAWAKKTIVTTMSPERGGFVVRVALVDEKGTQHGTRDLRTGGECIELLGASALAIAIAIDPHRLVAPLETRESASPVAPSAVPIPARTERVPASPKPEPAPSASPSGVFFEGSGGIVASVGVAPAPAAGADLGAALRSQSWSFGIEGRIDAPAKVDAMGGGAVRAWTVLVALVPCAYGGRLFACALGQAGTMQTSSEGVAITRSESLAWLAAGLRFGVELPIERLTAVRIRSDLLADFAPATLRLNGATAWTAPPVAASLGGDVVAHF